MNSIPFEAWAEVDMRSNDERMLDKMEQNLLRCAREGVEEENRQRAASETRLSLVAKLLAVRKAVHTDPNSPLVQAAIWAAQAMGVKPALVAASTDSNVPESMGIPAVTLTGGGKGGNCHSLEEWFDLENAWRGVQQVFLTMMSFDDR